MKLTYIAVMIGAAFMGAGQAHAQRYRVTNLGTLGGSTGAANAINNRGWVMGAAYLPGNTTEHATVWVNGQIHDLGTLGGPNSSIAWTALKNNHGVLAGISDTSIVDPLGETWSCAAGFLSERHRPHLPRFPVERPHHVRSTNARRKQRLCGWDE